MIWGLSEVVRKLGLQVHKLERLVPERGSRHEVAQREARHKNDPTRLKLSRVPSIRAAQLENEVGLCPFCDGRLLLQFNGLYETFCHSPECTREYHACHRGWLREKKRRRRGV